LSSETTAFQTAAKLDPGSSVNDGPPGVTSKYSV
jgi:hypothetical protein